MYYIIQQNLFKEHHFGTLTSFLTRHGFEYEVVSYRPFEDPVVKTDRKDVWIFGSFNMGFKLADRKWSPGLIYDPNMFNFEEYLTHYGEHLLNSDGKIQRVGNIQDWGPGEKFIRPTHDTKTFDSNVYTEKQWEDYIFEICDNETLDEVRSQTGMFYCTPKGGIQQEIRCWIVDGKMVTCSQYRIGRRINMLNMDHNEDVRVFVKDMCKIYQPARAFVMDICLYNDEYKIVELGCIHHCGFYDANMGKLIESIENTFGHGLSSRFFKATDGTSSATS
jgi:hypothetical protein